MNSWHRKRPILAFFCNWAPYRCYLELGQSGMVLPYSICPIKVMCAGRLDTAIVLSAFEKGAEGVVIIGCKEKECRYGPGPGQTKKISETIRGLMHILGLEPERFSMVAFSYNEKNRLFKEMKSFAKTLSKLGKSPFALD